MSRHRDERGAAMFIVLMVIMMLSAIGTFAVTNARYETQTAGFERQRNITNEVVNFGAYATTSELGSAPEAYYRLVSRSSEICKANAGLALQPCYHLYISDIASRTSNPEVISRPDPDLGAPGSLGLGIKNFGASTKSGINGGFVVEITEPYTWVRPLAGNPIDGSPGTPTFYDFTITSSGYVFHDLNLNGTIDASERGSATYATGRGHVLFGPIMSR